MSAAITAHVTGLVYWKSEHDEQTCEDALAANASAGLFAVADGVGTTLFSNVWARLLVNHFVDTPLLSADPFEVEWWVRQAQERYQQQLPSLEHLPWNALQKVRGEGSYSTLAAVAITQVTDTSAHALLLAFGDSCILVRSAATQQIMAFPLAAPADFDSAPICLPSRLSNFNRYFHRGHLREVDLAPGDTLLLATDVVARWIISAGNGHCADQHEAFLQVLAQTPASWPAFVKECRARDQMADDDCAALVITFGSNQDVPLGSTFAHRQSIREQRKSAFLKALQERKKDLVAITFGDGADLRLANVSFPTDQLQQARQVADALREVLQVLRHEVNSPDAAARITPVWQKYARLLHAEPGAASIRQTLARLGVPLAPVLPAAAPDVMAPPQTQQEQLPAEPPLEPEISAAPAREESQEIEEPGVALEAPARGASEQQRTTRITAPFVGSDRVALPLAGDMPPHSAAREAAPLVDDLDPSAQVADRVASPLEDDLQQQRDMMSSRRIQLDLERRLLRAINSDNDQEIVAAHDAIRHSPHGHGVVILLRARQRIMLARQRLANGHEAAPGNHDNHAAPQAASASQRLPDIPLMLASGLPNIDETWFRKVCSVKQAYLLHWLFKQMEPDQFERMTLDDLLNDPLVKAGIDEINRDNNASLLLPNALLPDTLKNFKNDPTVGYDELLSMHELTEDEVKAILLMFLRRQLFEEYLLWQRMAQVQEREHDSAQDAFRQRLITAYPWISMLSWWEER